MAVPTNQDLKNLPNVDSMVDANHELWAVSYHYLVPKGTDIEVFLADMVKGNFENGSKNLGDFLAGLKIVDITKL